MRRTTSFPDISAGFLALITGLLLISRSLMTSWSSTLDQMFYWRPLPTNPFNTRSQFFISPSYDPHCIQETPYLSAWRCVQRTSGFLEDIYLSAGILILVVVSFFHLSSDNKMSKLNDQPIHERKGGKLNEMVNDPKVELATPGRKKTRKPKKSMVNDNAEINTNMLQNEKTDELNGQLMTKRNIGQLSVSNIELGKGSNGTIVWEGTFGRRLVAVKRILIEHCGGASKEIQHLMESDQHPNIVQLYGVEKDKDFVYVALELCICNLRELILPPIGSRVQLQLTSGVLKDFKSPKPNEHLSPKLLKVMSDMVSGIAYMHKHKIIHRDLKPENILIQEEDGSISAKISDMGISKSLPANMSSVSNATGSGSSGWQAPEQLDKKPETLAADLFSLGCLLYYFMTSGNHPFGDENERDRNIQKNMKNILLVANIPEAYDLIDRLLHPNPTSRPSAAEVLNHPLFWNSDKRLSFLRDASDFIESGDLKITPELLKALENIVLGAPNKKGRTFKWNRRLDWNFLKEMGRHRYYKYDSICDLLRIIRNTSNHYLQLPKPLRAILGPPPLGYESYYRSKFPKLLMEVHKVLQVDCGQEEILQRYYRQGPL